MKNTITVSFAFCILLVALSGCVSKKKYSELDTLQGKTQDLLNASKKKNQQLQKENADLTAQLNDCNDARNKLARDTTQLLGKQAELQRELAQTKSSCNQLRQNYDQLKNKSGEKLRDMMNQLEALQSDLTERERRLAEVQRQLHQRDSVVQAIRDRITNALLGYQDKGLTVDVRDGKVYVSLSNKLLFASGSTKIDQNGRKALAELAKALQEQDDISIMVEGHTDDVPVANLGDIKDNWDLSVMRSTEVVRILVDNGLAPTRVIPSGRSEYLPKEKGKSAEVRATNRRTEIIITPQLDALFDLINSSNN